MIFNYCLFNWVCSYKKLYYLKYLKLGKEYSSKTYYRLKLPFYCPEKIRLGKGLDAVTTEEEIQYFERAVALGKRENQEVYPANISDLLAKQVKGHIITNKQYDA